MLEIGLMSAAGVGRPLLKAPSSVNNRESTQEKGLMIAGNVGKLSAIFLICTSIKELMMEISFPNSVIMETPSAMVPVCLSTRKVTLERSLRTVASVAMHLARAFFYFNVKGVTEKT